MKALVLVLSDIHIRNPSDFVLKRTDKIVDATKNLESNLDSIIVLLCGDTTYSGSETEFLLAIDFLTDLKAKIANHFPGLPFFVIGIPGNHDCDFQQIGHARETVAQAVRLSPEKLLDKSFANICLEPQAHFFDFLGTLDTPPSIDHRVDVRLYREYRVSTLSGSISFCCCNTAALSQIHEQPGSLVYPEGVIKQGAPEADVSIGLLHHPYNWLKPDNAKVVYGEISHITDYVITGHEHILFLKSQTTTDTYNVFLEAGVLQDSRDPDRSEFSVILLDAKMKKQRLINFSWSSDAYLPLNGDIEQFHLWDDLTQNPKRLKESFPLREDFMDFLEDLEVNLTHRSRDQLRLSDLYVFPDLKRIFLNSQQGGITKGDLVPTLPRTHPCLFIVGDDFSGKTALAKQFFTDLRNQGDIPVFLDASRDALSEGHLETQIERAFLRQYKNVNANHYRQLDKAKRVLIVDNYHRVALSAEKKSSLLRALRQHSFRLLIFAHDLELTFSDISSAYDNISTEISFSFFLILPFNLLRRNRIVEKWLMLDQQMDINTEKFVYNLDLITTQLDSLVGQNFIPAYPSYILAVLQATEAGTEIDVNVSTHGYLYELFIKSAIAKRTTAVGFNVISSYLAHLSFWMYSHSRRDISSSELKMFHQKLQERLEVLPDVDRLVNEMSDIQLLQVKGDSIRIRHRYIYYYFLAVYLRDNLHAQETKHEITKISSKLYREDEANIILFLSHLSKDHLIVNTLIAVANNQCAARKEAALGEDVAFLNKLNSDVNKLRLEDLGHRESRERHLEALQATQGEALSAPPANENIQEQVDETSFICQINVALKSIQILGQFLKNFPADIEKEKKDEVIRACCSAGRRVLGCFMDLMSAGKDDMIREMLGTINKYHPDLRVEKAQEKIVSILIAFSELASAGVVLRLSQALGSKTLMPIYERFFWESNEPILRLVYASLQLSHLEHFPKVMIREEATALNKNAFAFRILRFLVLRRLSLYPTDLKTKQMLSTQFHFEIKHVRSPKGELLIEG